LTVLKILLFLFVREIDGRKKNLFFTNLLFRRKLIF
jgi:hypothetical protein